MLVAALIFIVLLTSLGTSAFNGAILEEKMASNYRQQLLSRLTTESAVNVAKRQLNDTSPLDDSWSQQITLQQDGTEASVIISHVTGGYQFTSTGSAYGANNSLTVQSATADDGSQVTTSWSDL